MFTGIIEGMGRIRSVTDGDRVRAFRIEAPEGFLDEVRVGDSIAVDGACLTAVTVDSDHFTVEVIPQTLERTVAGGYAPGTVVNLERSMRLGHRMDGHLVQGHVDGMADLIESIKEGDAWRLRLRLPAQVHRGTIVHGSIALNGVSLTVDVLEAPDRLEVGIIPHTWTTTNLSHLAPGSRVNVEGDMIGKYVGRWMEARAATDAPPAPDPARHVPT
jgi:riboflavin synthase